MSLLAARRKILAAVLAVAVLAGCAAPSASFQTWRPASTNVDAVRRIVMLKFRGPSEAASVAQSAVAARLRSGRFYEVVDEADLQRYSPISLYNQDGSPNFQAVMEASRRAGVDAMLVADVKFVHNDEKPYGTRVFQIGDTQVTAKLAYQLIDVRTGFVRSQDTASKFYMGELEHSRTGDHSEQKVFGRLVEACAQQVVEKMAPSLATVEVPLDDLYFGKAAGEMASGNRSAQEGNWAQAMRHWQAALDAEPGNPAALYNLGLAYEAHYDFVRAKQLYATAAAAKDRKHYLEALERVDRAGRDHHIVAAQFQRHPPETYAQPASYSPPR